MPLRLKWRTRAKVDLYRIVEYIALQNSDRVVAERFGQRLIARCRELTVASGSGSPSPHVGDEVRKINEGAYKIYYRCERGEIVILRIWDGRRGTDPRV